MAAVGIDVDVTYEYSYVQSTIANGMKKMVAVFNDLAVEGWQVVTMDDIDHTIGTNTITAIVRRAIEPPPSPDQNGEGWYPDPTGRFDQRMWNGRAWTFHVATNADKSTHRDPPTMRAPTAGLKQ
jgi:hypothetical protein